MSDDLAFLELTELQGLLSGGAISSVELTGSVLDRLGRLGPRYNAVATVLRDRSLREAADSDRQRRRGRSGPLLGIPYGAKDLLAARGGPTTFGSAAFADQVLDYDAGVIERLARAGAVLTAKLALMELAAFHARRPSASLQGPGRNPWNVDLWAGGSSSGSGSAVAAGIVPFALGSETGGSIGTPASYCGITGLRPTYGLVSRFGAMPLSWTLDKIGPMGRSVRDCAIVLEAIAGRDQRDASSQGRRFSQVRAESIDGGRLDQLRVGFSTGDIEEAAQPVIRPALRAGFAALVEGGATLHETALPDLPYMAVISAITSAEGATVFAPLIESESLSLVADPDAREAMRASLGISARTYLNATRLRRRIQAAFRKVFAEVDLLATYTLPWPATPIDEAFTPVPITGGLTAMVAASNLAGLPALFVPCGFTGTGLPVGLQLVGPPFSEDLLVAVGERFQTTSSWHRARPTV